MFSENSIYRCIVENVNEQDELPEGVHLPHPAPEEDDPFPIMFADGAQDGMAMYHIMPHDASEETLEDFREALRLISEAWAARSEVMSGEPEGGPAMEGSVVDGGSAAQAAADVISDASLREDSADGEADALEAMAEAALGRAGARDGAYSSMDEFRSLAGEYLDAHDAGEMFRFSVRLMAESDDRECVKYGILLMSLFNVGRQETIRQILKTLALSDEFTFFVILVMNTWEDGNEAIFETARHVHGWGRIHAVNELEPETEEIREWLMTEGFHNNVMTQYTVMTCFAKSGASHRIRDELTPGEFHAMGDLAAALVDDGGPFGSLVLTEEVSGFFEGYLDQCDRAELSILDYKHLGALQEFFRKRVSDQEDLEAFYIKCILLLYTPAARETVRDAIAAGDRSVMTMADALKIPYQEILLDAMRRDFGANYPDCCYCAGEAWADEVLALFREHMSPAEMAQYTEEVTFFGSTFLYNHPLSELLDYLKCAPRKGIDYVETGLSSEAEYVRKAAVDLTESWVETLDAPLSEVSAELYDAVREAFEIETDEDLAQKMCILLNDGIEAVDDGSGEFKLELVEDNYDFVEE